MTISNAAPILDDCHIGDSIAVNGACLTVTAFDKQEHGGWFQVWLANETLDRTDLGAHLLGFSVLCQVLSMIQVNERKATSSTLNVPWVPTYDLEDISCRYSDLPFDNITSSDIEL